MKSSAGKIPDKITADEIKQAFRDNLHSGIGRPERFATKAKNLTGKCAPPPDSDL